MMHQPLFEAGTTITWTATDSIGVTVTAIQTVTIQDTTDPIFGPPLTLTLSLNLTSHLW